MRPKKPFNWRHGNHNTKGELQNWVQQYQGHDGGTLPVVVGLVDPRNIKFKRHGTDFLYADHAYFDRGWGKHHFRLIRGEHHLTRVLDRPDDRLKKWDVQIEPWRKGGRSIVIIPPSIYYKPLYGVSDWLRRTVEELGRLTDRPIHIKATKGRLRECLLEEQDAHAVVCAISVAGMEAALMGVPVFSTPACCSWPINAGDLSKIETPTYPERYGWASSLAYASWHADELEQIAFRDYMYSLKEEVCA